MKWQEILHFHSIQKWLSFCRDFSPDDFWRKWKEKKIYAQKNCDFSFEKNEKKIKKSKSRINHFFWLSKKSKSLCFKRKRVLSDFVFLFLIIFFSNFRLGPSVLTFYKSWLEIEGTARSDLGPSIKISQLLLLLTWPCFRIFRFGRCVATEESLSESTMCAGKVPKIPADRKMRKIRFD